MLPRSQRLSVEQLNSVMEKGRVANSSIFLMRYISGQKDSRVAAVAPKKIIKTAIERNTVRRKIYEAVKDIKSKINNGIHIALFAKAGIETKKIKDIENDLESLFVKAGILR